MLRPFLIRGICPVLLVLMMASYGNTALAGEFFQQTFIENYCIDCHDRETKAGDFNIESLQSVTASNSIHWQKVWEQVSLKEMPPRTEKQPGNLDRMHFVNGVIKGLQEASHDQGGFHENQLPTKGNYVDHNLLFSDTVKQGEPASTPSRMWRIHPAACVTEASVTIEASPIVVLSS